MTPNRPKLRSEEYIQQAVVQLLLLKMHAGANVEELRAFLELCLDKVTSKQPVAKSKIETRGLDIHLLGSVLRAWHTQTEYLAEDGSPVALPITGRSSVTSLIRKYYPANKANSVIEMFRSSGLIRKKGRRGWIPTSRHARIPQLSHETLEHLAQGVAKYVQTVTSNVTAKSDAAVLFERSCKVSKLPTGEFQAFRSFVGEQAIAFITAIDDWLEARAASHLKGTRKLTTAGVYTFAYFDKPTRASQ